MSRAAFIENVARKGNMNKAEGSVASLAKGRCVIRGLPVHLMILRWPDGPVAMPWPRSERTVRDRRRARRSGLADNAALEGEHPGLALAQRAHHLEALDRGVGRLQRLEPAHGPDQKLELAVVGLDDVVEVFHLPVPRVLRALALGLQLRDGSGIGWRLVGVEHLGLLPLFQSSQRLAEESLRCLGVAGRREIEIDRVPELVHRPVQIRPLAADLDVGLVDAPTPRLRPAPLPAQTFLHLRAKRCTQR